MGEITSGLGIGGIGSDDYNIHTENVSSARRDGNGSNFGKRGLRYDEACETCGRETTICNDCGCCKKHCSC